MHKVIVESIATMTVKLNIKEKKNNLKVIERSIGRNIKQIEKLDTGSDGLTKQDWTWTIEGRNRKEINKMVLGSIGTQVPSEKGGMASQHGAGKAR